MRRALLTTLFTLSIVTDALTQPLAQAAAAAKARCPNGYCALAGIGRGIHYDPGRMQRAGQVQQRRGNVRLNWNLPWAALPDCSSLGRIFWMRFRRNKTYAWSRWYTMQQVDCSRPGRDWNTHTNYGTRPWGEVPYELVKPLGLAGRGQFDVEIRWTAPW